MAEEKADHEGQLTEAEVAEMKRSRDQAWREGEVKPTPLTKEVHYVEPVPQVYYSDTFGIYRCNCCGLPLREVDTELERALREGHVRLEDK